MEETKQLLQQIHQDNLDQRAATNKATSTMAHSLRKRDRIIRWVVVALLISGYLLYRDYRFKGCIQDWAKAYTTRSQKLAAPGSQRIDFFLQAYTEAAGAKHKRLTTAQRLRLIAELDKDRAEFSVLPKHSALAKQPQSELLALRDLVRSIRANAEYRAAAVKYPIPTAPDCAGIFG